MFWLAKIQGFDHRLFFWLNRSKYHAHLILPSKICSFIANGPLYIGIAIFLMVFGNSAISQTLAIAFALERPVYFFLKSTCRRARPSAALPTFVSAIIPGDRFSFPSGHTSGAFVFAGIIGSYFPVLSGPLLIWAGLVGLSRVLLGVHFVTDIMAGAAMGSLFALATLGYPGV